VMCFKNSRPALLDLKLSASEPLRRKCVLVLASVNVELLQLLPWIPVSDYTRWEVRVRFVMPPLLTDLPLALVIGYYMLACSTNDSLQEDYALHMSTASVSLLFALLSVCSRVVTRFCSAPSGLTGREKHYESSVDSCCAHDLAEPSSTHTHIFLDEKSEAELRQASAAPAGPSSSPPAIARADSIRASPPGLTALERAKTARRNAENERREAAGLARKNSWGFSMKRTSSSSRIEIRKSSFGRQPREPDPRIVQANASSDLLITGASGTRSVAGRSSAVQTHRAAELMSALASAEAVLDEPLRARRSSRERADSGSSTHEARSPSPRTSPQMKPSSGVEDGQLPPVHPPSVVRLADAPTSNMNPFLEEETQVATVAPPPGTVPAKASPPREAQATAKEGQISFPRANHCLQPLRSPPSGSSRSVMSTPPSAPIERQEGESLFDFWRRKSTDGPGNASESFV
jgi:hypothetical protein